MTYYVYIIECKTPNHFYIGMSSKLDIRILSHKIGRGSAFTKKHGFKRLVKSVICDNEQFAKQKEKETTQDYIIIYGKYNVRGSGWTATKGSD